MEMKYLSTKEVKRVTELLKKVIERKPTEWMDYNSFCSNMALEMNTTKPIIENCLITFYEAGYVNIKTVDGVKAIISIKARKRQEDEKIAYEKEIKEDLENAPKTQEEAKDLLKSFKPLED
jgi:hypothetical protein